MNILSKETNIIQVKNNLSYKEFFAGVGSFLSMGIGSVYAHQCGQFVALHALFTKINPYFVCDFTPSKPYCFLKLDEKKPLMRPELSITYRTGLGIVSAAEPITDIIDVALSSMIAWKTRKSNIKISLLFAAHASNNALNTFLFCLSSQGTGRGNFAQVQSYLGIPHSIQTAITGSVALSTMALLSYLMFSKKTSSLKQE